MTEQPPTLFVVDDDPSVRKALKRLLGSQGYRVETFGCAAEYLTREHYTGRGCVILDLRMPGLDGIELQSRLTAAGRDLPIIFLTAHGDVPASVQAMKEGAADFLLKPVDESALFRAVDQALARQAEQLAEQTVTAQARSRLASLTPREQEVLRCVLGGGLNKQIAAHLGIAEKTVKLHRAKVMVKMGATSAAELGRVCALLGISPQSCT
jgi:FixJ family two-component response regulator